MEITECNDKICNNEKDNNEKDNNEKDNNEKDSFCLPIGNCFLAECLCTD